MASGVLAAREVDGRAAARVAPVPRLAAGFAAVLAEEALAAEDLLAADFDFDALARLDAARELEERVVFPEEDRVPAVGIWIS